MKCRPVFYNRIGIFCDFLRKDCRGIADTGLNGILGTDCEAASAADAFVVIDMCFSVFNRRTAVRTDADTGTAADTKCRIHNGFSFPVLLHLSGAGTAAHTEIFEGAAEACLFMPFKVAQGNHHVGIHNGLSDLGFLDKRQIDRNVRLIGSLKSVCNDHMTARLQRRKAIEIRRIHMVKGILTAADIKGVAVGEKRFASKLPHIVHHDLCILRPEMGEIA